MSEENEEKEKPQKRLGEEEPTISETLVDKLAELLKKKLDETNQRLNAIETRLANQAINFTQIQDGIDALRADHTSIMQTQGPAPNEVEPLEWDPNKIVWEKAVSRKSGSQYDRSDNMNNPDFRSMREDLERQGGKLTRDGMFYWNFDNSTTVGRTKSRYPKNK